MMAAMVSPSNRIGTARSREYSIAMMAPRSAAAPDRVDRIERILAPSVNAAPASTCWHTSSPFRIDQRQNRGRRIDYSSTDKASHIIDSFCVIAVNSGGDAIRPHKVIKLLQLRLICDRIGTAWTEAANFRPSLTTSFVMEIRTAWLSSLYSLKNNAPNAKRSSLLNFLNRFTKSPANSLLIVVTAVIVKALHAIDAKELLCLSVSALILSGRNAPDVKR